MSIGCRFGAHKNISALELVSHSSRREAIMFLTRIVDEFDSFFAKVIQTEITNFLGPSSGPTVVGVGRRSVPMDLPTKTHHLAVNVHPREILNMNDMQIGIFDLIPGKIV